MRILDDDVVGVEREPVRGVLEGDGVEDLPALPRAPTSKLQPTARTFADELDPEHLHPRPARAGRGCLGSHRRRPPWRTVRQRRVRHMRDGDGLFCPFATLMQKQRGKVKRTRRNLPYSIAIERADGRIRTDDRPFAKVMIRLPSCPVWCRLLSFVPPFYVCLRASTSTIMSCYIACYQRVSPRFLGVCEPNVSQH